MKLAQVEIKKLYEINLKSIKTKQEVEYYFEMIDTAESYLKNALILLRESTMEQKRRYRILNNRLNARFDMACARASEINRSELRTYLDSTWKRIKLIEVSI